MEDQIRAILAKHIDSVACQESFPLTPETVKTLESAVKVLKLLDGSQSPDSDADFSGLSTAELLALATATAKDGR